MLSVFKKCIRMFLFVLFLFSLQRLKRGWKVITAPVADLTAGTSSAGVADIVNCFIVSLQSLWPCKSALYQRDTTSALQLHRGWQPPAERYRANSRRRNSVYVSYIKRARQEHKKNRWRLVTSQACDQLRGYCFGLSLPKLKKNGINQAKKFRK